MREKDFNEKNRFLKEMGDSNLSEYKMLTTDIDFLQNKIKGYVDAVSSRNTATQQYMSMLGEFTFDSDLTVPSELFPGVRVTAQTVDPDKLKAKTDKMKDAVVKINNDTERAGEYYRDIVMSLKRCLSVINDIYLKQQDIEVHEQDLLRELDSSYDIGLLSKTNN